jgi:hypothetical protein
VSELNGLLQSNGEDVIRLKPDATRVQANAFI